MIILKMRASFGKLNGELTLHEGFNLLCLPNESGKSTWSAFLLAMLYGIDTKEKASALNQHLPAKERYKPWDGRAMQGMIELIWQGRKITIERRSQGRTPMGIFEAYDTESGTPIPELTADNCGKMLCGVERSVFERTAFIRQLGLAVSEDHTLEKRLNSLVTTGEEGKSASELEQSLHEMRLKLSRPSTGRISRLNTQIEQTARNLDTLHAMQDEAMLLRAQVDQTQQELDRLNALSTRIEQAQNAKKHLALEELQQKAQAQELLCRRLQQQISEVPEETELHQLSRQLDETSNALQTAQLEHAFCPEAPQKPQPPSCFLGLSAKAAQEKQAADAAQYEQLCAATSPQKTPINLCAVVFFLGLALTFLNLYVGFAVLAVSAVMGALVIGSYSRRMAKFKENQHQAALILGRYGVDSIEQSALLTSNYVAQMQAYEQALCAYQQDTAKRKQRLTLAENDLASTVQQVRSFTPDCTDASHAKDAVSAALRLRTQLLSEQRTLELQQSQLLSLRQLLGDQGAHEIDTEALSLDAAKINYEKNAAAQLLFRLQAKLAEQNGKISATGDASALQAQLEEYQTQLTDAMEADAVVTLAQAALHQADEALRSRFSPQITAEAGTILAALTDDKYPNILLRQDMSLSVREADGTVMHPSAAMSCGTADQMYLALRLAMVRRLLSENAPILLDDALVNFDDERTAATIRLLREEAKNRQIILFTCKEISHVL